MGAYNVDIKVSQNGFNVRGFVQCKRMSTYRGLKAGSR